MAGDWQHWKDLLSEGWKFVIGPSAGFVLGKVTDLRKWREERARKTKLRAMADAEKKRYQKIIAQWGEPGSLKSGSGGTTATSARVSLETAVKAYRAAGDEEEALKMEKDARVWELLFDRQVAPDPKAEAENARRAKYVETQHTLYDRFLSSAEFHKHKAGTAYHGYLRKAREAAQSIAEVYRKSDDLVAALEWEKAVKEVDRKLSAPLIG